MSSQDKTLHVETIHAFLALYRYMRRYGRQMQERDLSGGKLSVLRYLLEVGPLTIGQLRKYLCLSCSSTSEKVSTLERAGYVTRTRSELDQRVVIVDLTSAGQDIAQTTPLGGIPLLRERLKALPQERLRVINEAMTEMLQLLGIANGN